LTVSAFSFLARPAFSQGPNEQPSPVPVRFDPQADVQDNAAAQQNSQNQQEKFKKKKERTNDRVFFVMPNYLTVEDESQVQPLSWKEKFTTTSLEAFDPYEFAIVGVVAGIRQADNAYPSFGQGMEGYAKRYGTAFADQADGNIMVGAVYPSILRTDPRYFRLGKGSFTHRFGYAFSRIFATRKDSGGRMFNVSEFAGNATAVAISNVYYPAADRNFSSNINNWGVQMGIDALGNELKEFWPDIHKYLRRKKKSEPPVQPPAN
jgi:hypothetical protein